MASHNLFLNSQQQFAQQTGRMTNSVERQSSNTGTVNLTGFGQPVRAFDANTTTASTPNMNELLGTVMAAMMAMMVQLMTQLITTLLSDKPSNDKPNSETSENNTAAKNENNESTSSGRETETQASTPQATEVNNTGGADNVSRQSIQATQQNSDTGANKALLKAESLLGKNENTDTEELQGILQGINPAETPWCAYFVSAMLDENGGAPWKADLGHAGYVPTIRSWAQEKGVYHQPGGDYQPKPGDVVIEGDADHIELVKDVIVENGKVVGVITIGGNTSDSVKQSERRFDEGYVTGIVQV